MMLYFGRFVALQQVPASRKEADAGQECGDSFCGCVNEIDTRVDSLYRLSSQICSLLTYTEGRTIQRRITELTTYAEDLKIQ